jgi:quercetin dioxygenase-like cupin family protein
MLATGSLDAHGLTTALASILPGAELPYHRHSFSEAIVVLEGRAEILAEGRRYRLHPSDAVHLHAGTALAVRNASAKTPAVPHSSFASNNPTRDSVSVEFPPPDREEPDTEAPERLVRFAVVSFYDPASRAFFRGRFARRLESRGISGGYGLFEPGASLPCHDHGFDESITIVAGPPADRSPIGSTNSRTTAPRASREGGHIASSTAPTGRGRWSGITRATSPSGPSSIPVIAKGSCPSPTCRDHSRL